MHASLTLATMAVVAVVAAGTSLRPVKSTSGPFCFNTDICINSWTVAGGNVTFDVACNPSSAGALAWCSFAINADNTTKMYPAEAFWLGINTAGAVYVEDRILTAKAEGPCAKTQLTHVVASAVTARGNITATFTRPLVVPAALKAEGYVTIVNSPWEIIYAVGVGPRSNAVCQATGATKHYVKGHAVLNFGA